MEKIIVIKIGSSVIFTRRGKLDEFRLSNIAGQISALINSGTGVVLVVSGAVASAAPYININKPLIKSRYSMNLYEDQRIWKSILAGFGQVELISTMKRIFESKSLKIAQILLRRSDLEDSDIRTHLKKILTAGLTMGIIPVFNENDAIDLNSFGGNDLLAGSIAGLVGAKNLWILSTWEGSAFGVGGKATKDEVIEKLKNRGIKTVILDGKIKNVLSKNIL